MVHCAAFASVLEIACADTMRGSCVFCVGVWGVYDMMLTESHTM